MLEKNNEIIIIIVNVKINLTFTIIILLILPCTSVPCGHSVHIG